MTITTYLNRHCDVEIRNSEMWRILKWLRMKGLPSLAALPAALRRRKRYLAAL
ncbi:hypothetical protein [Mycolicibacterium fortuitum]|uniref:hypothetical protein n=1 Tax=Mycolicibacterium fortuitum TaxID=1766 RepID=UPI00149076C9|nr:hypothetical protein [Mycolicibacterium fortuitum]